jgi:hypothetical protein
MLRAVLLAEEVGIRRAGEHSARSRTGDLSDAGAEGPRHCNQINSGFLSKQVTMTIEEAVPESLLPAEAKGAAKRLVDRQLAVERAFCPSLHYALNLLLKSYLMAH